jgi:predicted membrane-bound mannosyltransferase
MKLEAPILIMSALGILISLLKGKHRVAMFTGLWGLGLFLAYTIIPYKTPWLALSYLLPLCIIAGYAIGELLSARDKRLRVAAAALAISGVALLCYQTYQQNFVRYDDDEMPYVYAHTRRGFLDLINEIERYSEKSGKGKDAAIEIVSPDYWPMTWYLVKHTRANFHGHFVPSTTSEIIIAKKDDQDRTAIEMYSKFYKYAGVYPLRPGVNLILLVRNDIADSDDQDMSKLSEYKPIQGYTN